MSLFNWCGSMGVQEDKEGDLLEGLWTMGDIASSGSKVVSVAICGGTRKGGV